MKEHFRNFDIFVKRTFRNLTTAVIAVSNLPCNIEIVKNGKSPASFSFIFGLFKQTTFFTIN